MTAPANDNFADAIVLSGSLPITRTGDTNVDATTEVDEPLLVNYGDVDASTEYEGIGASVWYAWTCGTTGTYSMRVDPDFDTVLTVYAGGTAFADLDRIDQSDTSYSVSAAQYETVYFEGTASQTYYFQAGGYDGDTGTFDLELVTFTRPTNDDFNNATTLTGTSDSDSSSNKGATTQVDEPRGIVGDYYTAAKTVWYEWTAPDPAGVTLSLTRSGDWETSTTGYSLPTLAVFTGGSVNGLTEVIPHTSTNEVKFLAADNETYNIQVGGRAGGELPEGDFEIALSANTSDNDYFELATPLVLTSGSASISGDNSDATMQVGEPKDFENFNNDPIELTRSIWWSWQAAVKCNATVVVSPLASNSRSVGIYTGAAVDDLTLVTSAYLETSAGTATWTALEDETYYIQIGNPVAEGVGGTVSATLTTTPLPPNDDWFDSTAITLTAGSATVSGTTTYATTEPAELLTFSSYGFAGTVTHTVWWDFTPDSDGVAVFDTFGSDFDTTAAVFAGGSLAGLSVIAFNDDYEGGTATIPQSEISWAAESGETYYVQVGGTASGEVTGHLEFDAYPTGGSADPGWDSGTASAYRIELRDLNSSGFDVTTESLELVTFSCNWRLNAPGAFEGSGVIGTVQADAANVGARELIVYKGSTAGGWTAIWGGYLTFFDADEDSKQVRVGAEGYWSRARGRLMRGNQIYKPLTNSGVAWKADVIAWDIIDQAQGATYGDMGWVYGGHSGARKDCKRIYYGVDRTNVGEAIEALAREGYFDFSVDVRSTPADGNVAQFRTWAKRGTNRTSTINLSSSNAMTLSYSLSSSDMATVIDVFGSVEGCRGVAATESGNLSTYGRIEARPIDMETDEQAEVDETASDFIDQHSVPAKNATATYLEGVGPDLTDYDLGDTIRVTPADGYVSSFDGRVVGRELAVEAARAVITVEVEL